MKLSYSQLSTYLHCPKAYELSYLRKLHPKMPASASFGSSLHNTLYRFYERIQQTQQSLSLFEEHNPDISEAALLEIFEENWFCRSYDSTSEEELAKKEAKQFLKSFYKTHENNWGTPSILEKGFALHLNGHIITGRFDRVDLIEEGLVEIIDYKTSERSQEAVDKDLQLSLYQLAMEHCFQLEVSALSLYFFKTNTKKSTTRTEEDMQNTQTFLLETIENIEANIKEDSFEAKPSKSNCAYCGQKQHCPFAFR